MTHVLEFHALHRYKQDKSICSPCDKRNVLVTTKALILEAPASTRFHCTHSFLMAIPREREREREREMKLLACHT